MTTRMGWTSGITLDEIIEMMENAERKSDGKRLRKSIQKDWDKRRKDRKASKLKEILK